MGKAIEQLKILLVSNPGIPLADGDICLFMSKAEIGKPYDKTIVTTKAGPGIGVSVPVTKHVGIGLFKRKVKTEVKTETAWKKTSCTLYVLAESFTFSVGNEVHHIKNDEITEMSIHKDALVIGSKKYYFYLFMNGKDIKRFQQVVQLIQQSVQEGNTMEELGYRNTKPNRNK